MCSLCDERISSKTLVKSQSLSPSSRAKSFVSYLDSACPHSYWVRRSISLLSPPLFGSLMFNNLLLTIIIIITKNNTNKYFIYNICNEDILLLYYVFFWCSKYVSKHIKCTGALHCGHILDKFSPLWQIIHLSSSFIFLLKRSITNESIIFQLFLI